MQKDSPIIYLLIFIFFSTIYYFSISYVVSISHDSIWYLNIIEKRELYFNPHHILYHQFAVYWDIFLKLFSNNITAITSVSFLNSIFGSLTLIVLFKLFYKILKFDFVLSLIGINVIGFSFGFWYYSSCIEVYIIPLFFIILTIYFLISDINILKKTKLAALTLGLAILFHQLNIFFIPIVLIYLFIKSKNENLKYWKLLIHFFVVFIPLIIIPYLFAAIIINKNYTVLAIWNYLTLYGHGSEFWEPFRITSFIKAFIGFIRALISFHFIINIEQIKTLFANIFHEKNIGEFSYFVQKMDIRMAYLLLILIVTYFVLILKIIIENLKNLKAIYLKYNSIMILISGLFFIYSIFFLFWVPTNLEFWIPQSVCFWVFILLIINYNKQNRKYKIYNYIITIITFLLVFINIFSCFIYSTDIKNDFYFYRMNNIIKLTDKNDIIITGGNYIIPYYLINNAKNKVFSIDYILDSNKTLNKKELISRFLLENISNNKIVMNFEAYFSKHQAIESYYFKDLIDEKIFKIEKFNFKNDSVFVISKNNSKN